MGADKSGDLILAEEDYAQEVRQDDSKVDSLLDEDDGESEPISIFSTADKRRLFIVEDIIKACAGCRPSFLFTGYVVERSPGALPLRSVSLPGKNHRKGPHAVLEIRAPQPKVQSLLSYEHVVQAQGKLGNRPPLPSLVGLSHAHHAFIFWFFVPSLLAPRSLGGGVPCT